MACAGSRRIGIDLCGHATLAAAHVVFERLGFAKEEIVFQTRSGELRVTRKGKLLRMDFPAQVPEPCACPPMLSDDDCLAVIESEDVVRAVTPDQSLLQQLDRRGVIVTARGHEAYFVSRFFAPKYGVPEDPVTGSAHCELTPYWAAKLAKNVLEARQFSRRGGTILCELQADRVILSGNAVTYLVGEITL